MRHKILYPERRWVSEAKIISWARDLWFDEHDFEQPPEPFGFPEARDYLEDMGEVTFSTEPPRA